MKIDPNLVAIVTGGASGLGEATVRLLRSKGARVVIADLNKEAGTALTTELGAEGTKFFQTNIVDEENIKQLVEFTVATFGGIHLLVNCAGVIHAGMFVSSKGVISSKELETCFRINVFGTFNMSKHAALQMSKQQPVEGERGVIVNVASVAGFEGQRGQTVYAATKGAIIGMTLPMARDLGKFGIRVMTVAPGIFQTPMAHGMSEKTQSALKSMSALGRNGHPREFAHCVLAMAQNPYASGETWRLDGGTRLANL